MIAGMIQRLIDFGFPACAEVARQGVDPTFNAPTYDGPKVKP
jgi:hypothetical protein